MALQSPIELDDVDWRILEELQADARLSYNELSRRVNLSSPAVAARVRRLEDAGVITGYHAAVDPSRAGFGLSAFIQMKCGDGRCLLKTARAADYPEVVEVHKLSGDFCSMLKVRTTSMQHFENLLERIGKHGSLRTSVVLSTQHDRRVVEPPADVPHEVTPAEGWGH